MPVSITITLLCAAAISATQIDTMERQDGSTTITIVVAATGNKLQDVIELFEPEPTK